MGGVPGPCRSIPLTDGNPQTFVPDIFEAKPKDFQEATMRVFHTRGRASRLEVFVVR